MCLCFFLFKQMTAYEMRISDWSSDVCSSDLGTLLAQAGADGDALRGIAAMLSRRLGQDAAIAFLARCASSFTAANAPRLAPKAHDLRTELGLPHGDPVEWRSEEHTSELQSLMRITYAVFCLKKKQNKEEKNTKT